MMISPAVLRILVLIGLLGMLLLAVFYLRERNLSFRQYLGWGLIAIFVPLVGPFLAIMSHPGQARR